MELRAASILSPLDVSERDDIVFDFTAGMRTGETIAAVGMSSTVERGSTDEAASSLVVDEPAIGRIDGDAFAADPAGRIVLQRVSAAGRPEGNVYCLRCVAATSTGRALTLACHIAIQRL